MMNNKNLTIEKTIDLVNDKMNLGNVGEDYVDLTRYCDIIDSLQIWDILKEDETPYSPYIRRGYFIVEDKKTLVTPKGQKWLEKKFMEWVNESCADMINDCHC